MLKYVKDPKRAKNLSGGINLKYILFTSSSDKTLNRTHSENRDGIDTKNVFSNVWKVAK